MCPSSFSHPFLRPTILGCALLSSFFVTNAIIAQQAPDDPVLQAMKTELDRERGISLQGMQVPYFIEYELDELTGYEAVATYGALAREENSRQRVVRVTVRVGDYKHDSSSARGDGTVNVAPIDNDTVAIQYALWQATDVAYKTALRAYATKQAALKQYQAAPAQNDFAEAKPVVKILPLQKLDFDREDWKHRIIEASGLYASDPEVRSFAPHIQYSIANVRAIAVNRYMVNTEGTMLRNGYTGYNATISLGTQAADGMPLSRENGTVGAKASELESATDFRNQTLDDIKSLEQLSTAPVIAAEDYHGPVLFSGDAASDIFNQLFVPNILADRPEMGTSARTTGAYASSLKANVLPEMMSVTDDPLETTFAGKQLLGAYTVDDEGVPAQAVDVVVKGQLDSFLLSRQPIRDFPISNGHGRSAPAQAAHAHPGVVILKPAQPLSHDDLNKRLLAMAKDQGHDVYEVQTMAGETPRLLYRVHVDGKRELVRGAQFDELDTRALRSNIVAAGDDPYIDNILGPIPETIIAPSLLFDNVGVKRATVEQNKLPYYDPPALTDK